MDNVEKFTRVYDVKCVCVSVGIARHSDDENKNWIDRQSVRRILKECARIKYITIFFPSRLEDARRKKVFVCFPFFLRLRDAHTREYRK